MNLADEQLCRNLLLSVVFITSLYINAEGEEYLRQRENNS